MQVVWYRNGHRPVVHLSHREHEQWHPSQVNQMNLQPYVVLNSVKNHTVVISDKSILILYTHHCMLFKPHLPTIIFIIIWAHDSLYLATWSVIWRLLLVYMRLL